MRLPTVLAVAALALAAAWIALAPAPTAPAASGDTDPSTSPTRFVAPSLAAPGSVSTARQPVHAPGASRIAGDPDHDPVPRPETLAPPFVVYGAVYREDGAPASRAHVALGKLSTRCNVSGLFRIETRTLPAHDAGVMAWETGFAPAILQNITARLPELRPGLPVGPLTLFLGARLPAVSGVVVDADGRPAKGWTISIERTSAIPGIDPCGPDSTARSTLTGSFTLTAVHPGPCRLVARRGKQQITAELTIPPDGLHALRLRPD